MANSKLKTQNLELALLVVAFLALASLYSFVTPLGEGPDEPGHAAYVFFLAREGRLPVQRAESAASDVPGEGHQPPLAYALAVPLIAWLPPEDRRLDLPGNPRFTWSGGTEPNAAGHGTRELWPWQGAVLAWHLARLLSVACGAAAVVFTYLAARALTDQRPTINDQSDLSSVLGPSSLVPLVAAAVVAFNPQFLFTTALVTNDALLAALSAAMLWLVVRRSIDERRPNTKDQTGLAWSLVLGPWSRVQQIGRGHALALGFVLGLALVTKQSALLLAPIALLSVLEQSWREVKIRGLEKSNASGSPGHLVILSHVLLFLVATAAVSGWWYARNWRLYGDPFGLAAFQAEFVTQAFDVASFDAWVAALKQLHGSFWARFGWMNLRPPGWVIWFFAAVEAVSLAGLLRLAWSVFRGDRETGRLGDDNVPSPFSLSLRRLSNGKWMLLALPILAFAWVVSFALTAGLVAWQARLLFPALPAIAIVLAFGLALLLTNTRRQGGQGTTRQANSSFLFPVLLVSALPVVALWVPFGVIRPAYPFQVVSEREALAQLGTPVYARLGKPGDAGAEVRGWWVVNEPRAGDTLALALTWRARGRQNRDWTVFVHLVDARDTIGAEDNRQPRDGAFPMTQWVAGDWVEDHHSLALPPDLSPGSYSLRVGLWDPSTGERAAVYNQKGKLIGDYVDIGKVTVKG
jgi:hypothetical protein